VPGETGYLVPLDSRSAFAKWTLPLFDDPALARRFGAAGQARMRAEFSVEKMINRYAHLYDELLA
jgi:glycosyltransferase involved in cell wall biosynthesis